MIFDAPSFLLAAATLPIAVVAMLIDRLFGYPTGLQARAGHPVVGELAKLLIDQG